MSRQQIQELMALRRVFLPKMGQLLRNRQRISRALQESQLCVGEDTDPDGPTTQYTEANDVLRDLKSNLRDDKLLLMQVLASVWRKVPSLFTSLNSFQKEHSSCLLYYQCC